MPSRTVTAVGVLVVVVLAAGCTGLYDADASGGPLRTVSSPGCGDDFERTPLTNPNATAAKQFAVACETSRIVQPNGYVSRHVEVLAHGESGWYVRASVLVGTETGQTSAVYFVGGGEYSRVEPTREPVDDYFHSTNASENAALDASLLNFGEGDREPEVTLTYLNTSSPTEVFGRTYSLPSQSGVVVAPVTMRTGSYNVTLWDGDEPNETERIVLTEENATPLVFLIEPNGNTMLVREQANGTWR